MTEPFTVHTSGRRRLGKKMARSIVLSFALGACVGVIVLALLVVVTHPDSSFWWYLVAAVAAGFAAGIALGLYNLWRVGRRLRQWLSARRPRRIFEGDRAGAAREARVTVIIPAYCEEEHLGEALESLARQTYPRWRAIVVDDQSPDSTSAEAARVAASDPRVSVVRLRRNSRLPAARNVGLSMAETDFVLFLDGDDVLLPRALEERIAALDADPTAAGAYGRCVQVPFDVDWRAEGRKNRSTSRRRITLLSAAGENPFSVHEVLLRAQAAWDLSGFNEELRGGGEDWDFWARSLRSGHEYVGTGQADCLYRQTSYSMVAGDTATHMLSVAPMMEGLWSGEGSRAEVRHRASLDGPLGEVLHKGTWESRLFRYAGMASSDVDLDVVLEQLRAAAPFAMSRAAADHDVFAGARRAAKRAGISNSNVARAATSRVMLQLSAQFAESPVEMVAREDHPSWAILVENRAQVAAISVALSELDPSHLPLLIVADSVDADQGGGDLAGEWVALVRSVPKYLLEGVAYSQLLVPGPVSWIGGQVAAHAAHLGSQVNLLTFPFAIDDVVTDLPRRAVSDLPRMAHDHACRTMPRARLTGHSREYAGSTDLRGARGDRAGLVLPSRDRLLELRDSFQGQRVLVVSDPSELLEGPTSADVSQLLVSDENTWTLIVGGAEVPARGPGGSDPRGLRFVPTMSEVLGTDREVVRYRLNTGFHDAGDLNEGRARFSTNASEVVYDGDPRVLVGLQLAHWLGFSAVAVRGVTSPTNGLALAEAILATMGRELIDCSERDAGLGLVRESLAEFLAR